MDGAINAAIDIEIAAERRHVLLRRIIDLYAQIVRGPEMEQGSQFITERGKAAPMFTKELAVEIGFRRQVTPPRNG